MFRFKLFYFVFLPLILTQLFAASTAAEAQTQSDLPSVTELFRLYLDENGGRSNIAELISLRMTGEIEYPSGEKFALKIYMKRPSLMRLSVTRSNYVSNLYYDGDQGWQVINHSDGRVDKSELTEEDLNNLKAGSYLEGAFFQVLGRQDWIESVTMDSVRGQHACRLDLGPKVDLPLDAIWLSLENFQEVKLLRKITEPDGDVVSLETYFEDFAEIDGISFARRIETCKDGEFVHTIHVNDIQTNLGLFESFFKIN